MTRPSKLTHRDCIYILVAIVLASLTLSGCTTIKSFVPPEDAPWGDVFPGHEIEPLFENSLYSEDRNIFRIDICQRQPVPADSTDVRELAYVRVEELGFLFNGDGNLVRPTPEKSPDYEWRKVLDDGFLHGPMLHWGWLHIPASCEWVEVTYTAVLVDGANAEELERRTVSQVLRRKHDRVFSIVK